MSNLNPFDAAQSVETAGQKIFLEYLDHSPYCLRYVVNKFNENRIELQKHYGDIFVNNSVGDLILIDLKIEKVNKFGNFFLETYSNKETEGDGWFWYSGVDYIVYGFLDSCEFYIIPFKELCRWASENHRLENFKEKEQKKYKQYNDTWGRPVPIKVIMEELGAGVFKLDLKEFA